MDKKLSDQFKEIQKLIKKESTFEAAIESLLKLRSDLLQDISQIVKKYPIEAFYQMPFPNVDGYHKKTLSYSIWHIARIEDIVVHEMIVKDEQILFKDNYLKRIGASIITTGNELEGEELVEFSKDINIKVLLNYASDVIESTNRELVKLDFKEAKSRFTEEDKKRLLQSKCVSTSESSIWLIDYWCSKDIIGLILMPFSKHWMMHIDAMHRIKNKLCKMARKGVDPIAYCGLYCNHCFLSEWCGSCRTRYNACSYATLFEDGICPNVKCCENKKLDGCYECENLINCTKGFYSINNPASNECKVQALYIQKHGRKEFLEVHKRMEKKYDFAKEQRIFGTSIEEGLKILEEN